MTSLESLIRQQVQASVVATVSRTTDKIADQLASEILSDSDFRARMRALIIAAFEDTVTALLKEQRP